MKLHVSDVGGKLCKHGDNLLCHSLTSVLTTASPCCWCLNDLRSKGITKRHYSQTLEVNASSATQSRYWSDPSLQVICTGIITLLRLMPLQHCARFGLTPPASTFTLRVVLLEGRGGRGFYAASTWQWWLTPSHRSLPSLARPSPRPTLHSGSVSRKTIRLEYRFWMRSSRFF